VKKWLVKWLKARRTEEDDVNDGRGEPHGGREEPGTTGTTGWKSPVAQIRNFLNFKLKNKYQGPKSRSLAGESSAMSKIFVTLKRLYIKTGNMATRLVSSKKASLKYHESGRRKLVSRKNNSVHHSVIKTSGNKRETSRVRKCTKETREETRGPTTEINILAIIVSIEIMIYLTIYLMLLQQTVERNPGPKQERQTSTILTYNTNGLGESSKLKRLLKKIEPIVEKGGIALLQETHIVKTEYIKMIWKHKFVSNCISTNSAGVIILFNNEYELLEEFSDKVGRTLIIAIKNEDKKIIVANTYYPNNHRLSLTFASNLYEEILRFQQAYPEFDTICTGDINTCLTDEDCLNRNRTKIEENLSTLITDNNKVIEVKDAYRKLNPKGGHTWKRGECYSRLDYIFLSNHLFNKITKTELDWAFEKSDHAALLIYLKEDIKTKQGPGLPKINTKILEDPVVTMEIGNEILTMLNQMEDSWNPHAKLEFLKVCIRSVFASKVTDIKRNTNEETSNIEDELNQLEELRLNIVQKQTEERSKSVYNIESVDSAILTLKNQLQNIRLKLSDKIKFVSKAKWFEYGEKSNKFFLRLNEWRKKQKTIDSIKDGKKESTGQNEVMKCIRDFYKDLYDRIIVNNDEDNFYANCPKLSESDAKYMDEKLTLKDLQNALKTCKDSAPGPDGIPYSVYKKFWTITGKIILDAWNYSLETGNLTTSHTESTIILLPKEGKDKGEIKNWRPITLTNCDAKIITKALAIKISKTLHSIIDPSQTAYVSGRAVTDNLRANFFLKNHCKQKRINAALISLDAKKAFDSVDHKYIKKTLEAYGFGEGFIRTFQTLYKNITARILVNGYTTEPIQINRGVKQGDALSCAIFIICIDPLLRNLNKNMNIKQIKIGRRNNISFKAAAYADDISVICENSQECIQQVFNEYERLTKRSGLELNAEKTEILLLANENIERKKFEYNEKTFEISTVKSIKICGLHYCSNKEVEYTLNVHEKIEKLKNKIRAWSHRSLTMEGKSLIVKTYGTSQIIYNMQSYNFEKEEITEIERTVFKFIWSNSETQNGVDRIKRSIMKNDYQNGGMSITDYECLNRSLKLRQFIRANKTNHPISNIQDCLSNSKHLQHEYKIVTSKEAICEVAQDTINRITDHTRDHYTTLKPEEYENDTLIINEVSAINLETYFKRKSKLLVSCILIHLTKLGINTLGELILSNEYEKDARSAKTMKIILSYIPENLKNISSCYNEDINTDNDELQSMLITKDERIRITDLTVKQLQNLLKKALNKTESLDVKNKLQINNFDNENIMNFRSTCKNAKLRNIYFRLIHNDFFTHSRMKRYKMTTSDKCPRCEETETTKHLLWECNHVKNIWRLYNIFLNQLNLESEKVLIYDDIYIPGKTSATCLIKIRIIQELIQIERPKNWTFERIKCICKEVMNLEKYNAIAGRTMHTFSRKWSLIYANPELM
jgi:exonuclease III